MFHTVSTLRIAAALLIAALASLVAVAPAAAQQSLAANRIWVHTPGRITALAPGGPSISLPQARVEPTVQAAPNGSFLAYAELSASGRFERLVGITARTGERRILHAAAGAKSRSPSSRRIAARSRSASSSAKAGN